MFRLVWIELIETPYQGFLKHIVIWSKNPQGEDENLVICVWIMVLLHLGQSKPNCYSHSTQTDPESQWVSDQAD